MRQELIREYRRRLLWGDIPARMTNRGWAAARTAKNVYAEMTPEERAVVDRNPGFAFGIDKGWTFMIIAMVLALISMVIRVFNGSTSDKKDTIETLQTYDER